MSNFLPVVLILGAVVVVGLVARKFFASKSQPSTPAPSTGGGSGTIVTPTPPSVENPNLEAMTKAELLELASEKGISVGSRARKVEIVDALLSQQPNQQ